MVSVGSKQSSLEDLMWQLAGNQVALQRSVEGVIGGVEALRKDVAAVVHPPPAGGAPEAARKRTEG